MTSLFQNENVQRKTLRPYQQDAIDKVKLSFGKGNRKTVLQLPTGGGKTLVSANIIERALSRGNEVLFTVPYLPLVDQTISSFQAEGIDSIGAMQGNHPMSNPLAKVQVATVQTLRNRQFPPASLVIIDECHRRDKAIEKIMAERDDVYWLGLSATPWAQGMGKVWDDLQIGTTIGDLIEQGYLCKFRAFSISKPDLSGVKVRRGDYVEADISEIMGDKKIVGDVVENWLRNGENRPTFVFCVDRRHAAKVHERFTEAGISSAYVDGNTDHVERHAIERRFRDGDVRVVCSVRTLTTGVDWPVSCVIDAAPTQSEMLHIQKWGRGLRVNPPYSNCLFFDHAGNSLRLGLPTQIHHETLDMGEKRDAKRKNDAEEKTKDCPHCSTVIPKSVMVCMTCGHEFKRPPSRDVESVDGELVEIGEKQKKPDKDDKQKFYSMALKYAELKGYKKGWAANKYREKFSVWPRGLDEVTEYPDAAFMNFIKARQIAYAKKMEKARA